MEGHSRAGENVEENGIIIHARLVFVLGFWHRTVYLPVEHKLWAWNRCQNLPPAWYLWKAGLVALRWLCPGLSTERQALPWPWPADSYHRASFHTRERTQKKQQSNPFIPNCTQLQSTNSGKRGPHDYSFYSFPEILLVEVFPLKRKIHKPCFHMWDNIPD